MREELRASTAARKRKLRDLETFPIIALPSQRNRLRRVAAGRKQAFRKYLENLVERVFAAAPTRPAAPEEQTSAPCASSPAGRLTTRACTLCKGQCCVSGGRNNAWIKLETIVRYRDAHPDGSAHEIVNTYMAAIGSRTYQPSCIYHGSHGCTLSRELRSDTCNNYFCIPVREFHAQAPETADARAFLVFQDRAGAQRGRFVEEPF